MIARTALLASLLLSACGVEAESTDSLAATQAPPPGYPQFVVSEMFPGSDFTMTWAELPPNARVRILVSTQGQGDGPCPPVLQGACLGIQGPVIMVGEATANADGIATVTRTLPSGFSASGPLAFQAVASSPTTGLILSDVYDRFVGPGICGFIFAPVCGWDGVIYDNECIAHVFGQPVQQPGSCP